MSAQQHLQLWTGSAASGNAGNHQDQKQKWDLVHVIDPEDRGLDYQTQATETCPTFQVVLSSDPNGA